MLVKLQKISTGDISQTEIDDAVFGVKDINQVAIAQVIRWQLHKRSGYTSFTKTRSDVKGSGRKIYRQKGTGNARHSAKYAPQFRKGGVAHGPKAVQWTMSVPKKIKKLALKHVLSYKSNSDALIIADDLHFNVPKTKEFISKFSDLKGKKVLFIDNQVTDSCLAKSLSNIVGFNYLPVVGLNVYDILRAEVIVISQKSIEDIKARLV